MYLTGVIVVFFNTIAQATNDGGVLNWLSTKIRSRWTFYASNFRVFNCGISFLF